MPMTDEGYKEAINRAREIIRTTGSLERNNGFPLLAFQEVLRHLLSEWRRVKETQP